MNRNEGFIAGRFVGSEIVPAYPPTEIDHLLSYIESHIDRDSPHHSGVRTMASPFISASNFLAASLRLALRRGKDRARQLRVTVIDAERLNSRKILYVKPYHLMLTFKLALTHGAWKYPGNHEFLVWDRIPLEAIVHNRSNQMSCVVSAKGLSHVGSSRFQHTVLEASLVCAGALS
ncbi:hypothetical protein EJ03DRAFT_1623 [Teratosphaeria nubilosa]|uniref:DUF7587 domain-containing protein n=1 Tax=Teratosphaeria nubilosa TaxID=161662 RepID=A0A6G1LMZ4_9PEZI|nr:hypothetical protein EJ03DRAFT_1623 [Teratosphaeria nubilosa]